jgi:hypothetical protein
MKSRFEGVAMMPHDRTDWIVGMLAISLTAAFAALAPVLVHWDMLP